MVSGVSQALLSYPPTVSLSRTLVQAIGERLISIIPHIDDYSCLICTSIAFKPIRLTCGHFFGVRCLVKMQKRNNNLCPLCRAPYVLVANRGRWYMYVQIFSLRSAPRTKFLRVARRSAISRVSLWSISLDRKTWNARRRF